MRLTVRAEAHAIAAITRIGLRVLPVPRLASLLAHLPHARPTGDTIDECASAAADAAARSAHPTCLFTSLITFAMLARRGYGPRLVIGASRDDGFDAHAWVTVGESPLGTLEREYVPLWSCRVARREAR